MLNDKYYYGNMEKLIIKCIKEVLGKDEENIESNTSLIGSESPLDSMSLIALCLRLEEEAEEIGFNFDWSGDTMSKSKSMFRSVHELSKEFEVQKNLK